MITVEPEVCRKLYDLSQRLEKLIKYMAQSAIGDKHNTLIDNYHSVANHSFDLLICSINGNRKMPVYKCQSYIRDMNEVIDNILQAYDGVMVREINALKQIKEETEAIGIMLELAN